MLDRVTGQLDALQGWLFTSFVQPAMHALGWIAWAEPAFDATGVFVYGVAEIALIYAVLRPLEAWLPVERRGDRRGARVDVLYTWLNRLGVLPLLFFAVLLPVNDRVQSTLRMHDVIPPNLEDWIPWLAGAPLASFALYLVLIDLAEYWRHRLQHRFGWWWALHALHHSQRTMTFWTDSRNHLLDDLLGAAWIAALALLIGVPPTQFVGIVLVTRFVENLSHANVRLSFGRLGERLLVSPRFHRMHHAIGDGHEGPAMGCNFAVLFPAWDLLFGTARIADAWPATGIRDQLAGRDYGDGFWRQQWLGLGRMAAALGAPSRKVDAWKAAYRQAPSSRTSPPATLPSRGSPR